MDRKKNILVREMLLLLPRVAEIRGQISSTYAKAYLALQEANITLGIVNEIAKAIPLDNSLHVSYRNVMGVRYSGCDSHPNQTPPFLWFTVQRTLNLTMLIKCFKGP